MCSGHTLTNPSMQSNVSRYTPRALSLASAFIVTATMIACGKEKPSGRTAATGSSSPGSGTQQLGAPADGTWQSQAGDYGNTRYSPLHQIDARNASQLQSAWSFSTGYTHGHEGAPLVVGNTMFIVTPFPNVAYALDLTKTAPTLKWKFDPHPDPVAIGKACCDIVNRGWAYAD